MKKTIKKRAFVSAIAMLIVSAIVLTSSTFAWFSMSKEAKVEQMDLTVSSPEGIQISANASAWTANLTIDEIFNSKSTSRYKAYDNNVNLMPLNLIPVSAKFQYFDGGFARFFKAVLNDAGNATVTQLTQKAGDADNLGFVAFDLFFKVAEETKVYFGTSEFTDNSSSDVLTAMRVAFQNMGNTDGSNVENTIKLSGASASATVMYEVDTENRSADALARGNAKGAVTTKALNNTMAAGGVKDGLEGDFVLDNGYTSAPTCTFIKSTATNNEKSFTLPAGVTKMRIYIWLEGNDIDCRNSVAGAALSAALKFTIK